MIYKKFIGFLVFFAIFFICIELFCNRMYFLQWLDLLPNNESKYKSFLLPYIKVKSFNPNIEFYYDESRIYPAKNKKGAVSVVGCSCTEGIGLEHNETFAAVLNKLTGRKVYSRAKAGRGLPYVYYQIDNKLIPNDSEYIVFFYIPIQLLTLYNYQTHDLWDSSIMLRYEEKNGKIILKKPLNIFSYYSLYSVKMLQDFLTAKNFDKESKNYSLYSAMLLDMLDKLKINYPNTKFILVKFQVDEQIPASLPVKLEKLIQEKGAIILDAEELTGEKYYLLENKLEDEKIHPNAKVWRELTPQIVKSVGL